MTIEHLQQATAAYLNNEVLFNNGVAIHCFLYKNTWYPLRATINYASDLAGGRTDYTTNNALAVIQELIPYVTVDTIEIIDHNLVELTTQQKQNRIIKLTELIKELCQ